MEWLEKEWTKPRLLKAAGWDTGALSGIPPEMRTDGVCRLAVKQNGLALEFVPDALKTPELCAEAVRRDVWALAFLPGMPSREPAGFPDLLSLEGRTMLERLLELVPPRFMTERLCEAVAGQFGMALEWMPERLKTARVCLAAVRREGAALQYVPPALRTPELCMEAVRRNGKAVKHVPADVLTEEMRRIAMKPGRVKPPVHGAGGGSVDIDGLCKEWQMQKERIGEYSSLDLQSIARTGPVEKMKGVKRRKKKKRRF